jgi:DOPA 4,5-dioxygenase
MWQGLSPNATLCDNHIVSQDTPGARTVFDASADPIQVKGYHAHVYYVPGTRAVAERLRSTIAHEFTVEAGNLDDEPRGLHPIPQFNVIFNTALFDKVVPWLMLNREGLDALVHPLTASSYDDHSKNALWLGTPVELRLDTLRATYRAEQYPTG